MRKLLEVADDGKGIHESGDSPKCGLGGILVESLTTGMKGKMTVTQDKGTCVAIEFQKSDLYIQFLKPYPRLFPCFWKQSIPQSCDILLYDVECWQEY